MGDTQKTSTVVNFNVDTRGAEYVIEEDQPLVFYGEYHRTLRLYRGDDLVKVLVTTGVLKDIGDRVETIENFGFAFSGSSTAKTPYMLGSSGTVKDIKVEGDMYDNSGNIVTPTFLYDSDSGVLRSSEDCYGLVLGTVTIPYTLYGFRYSTTPRNDLGGYTGFAKSLMYVFGLVSGSVLTHNIPAVYPKNDLSKSDRIELWRIVSHRYITDETNNNIYEESAGADKYEFLPTDYQGTDPIGPRIRTTEVHEIAYMKPGGFNLTIELETFLVKAEIDTTAGFAVQNIGYPVTELVETYNEMDFDEDTRLQIKKALIERKEQHLKESNLNTRNWL